MLARVLIWNVAESKTTIDELRESLPELEAPSGWIWNEVTDGSASSRSAKSFPSSIGWAQDLVGDEPDVYEEFDFA